MDGELSVTQKHCWQWQTALHIAGDKLFTKRRFTPAFSRFGCLGSSSNSSSICLNARSPACRERAGDEEVSVRGVAVRNVCCATRRRVQSCRPVALQQAGAVKRSEVVTSSRDVIVTDDVCRCSPLVYGKMFPHLHSATFSSVVLLLVAFTHSKFAFHAGSAPVFSFLQLHHAIIRFYFINWAN